MATIYLFPKSNPKNRIKKELRFMTDDFLKTVLQHTGELVFVTDDNGK